jgi:hypothetical protein
MKAILQQRLKLKDTQQQQQQQATNSYSIPQSQLQQQPLAQQQQQDGRPVDPALATAESRIRSEHLQPWMLHFCMGAIKATCDLLPPSSEREQVLSMLRPPYSSSNYTNLSHLRQVVVQVLQGKRGAPDVQKWKNLGSLINQATEEGPPALLLQQQQQAPAMPPAAAAAPGPMLPPHLRHAAGARPNLPPHLQQHQPQQPQQPQAQANEGSGSDEDDVDTLLGLCGVPASAAADVHLTGWAAVTGHQQDEDASAADYPPLGSQQVSPEDAEMERALAASRADLATPAGRASRAVPGLSAAGLANQAGEYNCFLNVVVQCLWSCKAFTKEVCSIATQKSEYDKHPVVEALLNLFERMEAAESGWQPGHER